VEAAVERPFVTPTVISCFGTARQTANGASVAQASVRRGLREVGWRALRTSWSGSYQPHLRHQRLFSSAVLAGCSAGLGAVYVVGKELSIHFMKIFFLKMLSVYAWYTPLKVLPVRFLQLLGLGPAGPRVAHAHVHGHGLRVAGGSRSCTRSCQAI